MRGIVLALAAAGLPSLARADLTTREAGDALLPPACVVTIREVARELGLGHPEESREESRRAIAFSNGAADCDADAFTVEVAPDRRAAAAWATRTHDGSLLATARDGKRRIAISAGFSVARDRAQARAFLRRAREALTLCLREKLTSDE